MVIRVLNGTASNLSAFILVFGFSQFLTAGTASWAFQIPTCLFRCYIHYFPASKSSWTDTAIIVTYLMSPVVGLLGLLLGKIMYAAFGESSRNEKEFWSWFHLHSLNVCFGGLIAGVASGHGAGFLVSKFGAQDVGRVAVGLIAFFLLAFFSARWAKKFVMGVMSRRVLNSEAAFSQFFCSSVIPSFLGLAAIYVLVFYRIKQAFWAEQNELLVLLTLLPPLIIAFRFKPVRKAILLSRPVQVKGTGPEPHAKTKLAVATLFSACLICLAWLFALRHGLRLH
jgi:hypothetical protein